MTWPPFNCVGVLFLLFLPFRPGGAAGEHSIPVARAALLTVVWQCVSPGQGLERHGDQAKYSQGRHWACLYVVFSLQGERSF